MKINNNNPHRKVLNVRDHGMQQIDGKGLIYMASATVLVGLEIREVHYTLYQPHEHQGRVLREMVHNNLIMAVDEAVFEPRKDF